MVEASAGALGTGVEPRTWLLADFVGGTFEEKAVVAPLNGKLVIFAQPGRIETKAAVSINSGVNQKFTAYSTYSRADSRAE